MKCEVCGKPTEPKMCDWLTNVMCPEHAKQVKDYIEGLKPPKVTTELNSLGGVMGYRVVSRQSDVLVYKNEADALYKYMGRERGDTEVG